MDEALLCPQAAPARDQQLGDGRCEEGANCAQDWGPWMVRGCFSLILRWPEGTDSICSPSVGLRPHPCHSAQRAVAPGTSAYPVTSSCPRLPGSISEALLCCGADGVSKAVASLWEGGGSATMWFRHRWFYESDATAVCFPRETIRLVLGSDARHAGQQGRRQRARLELSLRRCGTPSPMRSHHLASPQIRVTVPSSRSSTVTATSSELV